MKSLFCRIYWWMWLLHCTFCTSLAFKSRCWFMKLLVETPFPQSLRRLFFFLPVLFQFLAPFVFISWSKPPSPLFSPSHWNPQPGDTSSKFKNHFSLSITVSPSLRLSELSIAGGHRGPPNVRACLSVTLHCPFNLHTHTPTHPHGASKGAVAWERQCNHRPLYQHCIVVCVGLLFHGQLVVIGSSLNRELLQHKTTALISVGTTVT